MQFSISREGQDMHVAQSTFSQQSKFCAEKQGRIIQIQGCLAIFTLNTRGDYNLLLIWLTPLNLGEGMWTDEKALSFAWFRIF